MVRDHLFLFAILTTASFACDGETFRKAHDDDAGASGEDTGGSGGGGKPTAGKAGSGAAGTAGTGTAGSGLADGGASSAGRGSDGGSSGSSAGSASGGQAGSSAGQAGASDAGEGGSPDPAAGTGGGGTGAAPVVDPVPAPGAAQSLPGGDTFNSTPPVLAPLGEGIVIAGYTRDAELAGLVELPPDTVAESFVAALARDGARLWSTPLAAATVPCAVAVDAAGDIVVLASYYEGGEQLYIGTSTDDLYLAKVHADGAISYTRRIPFGTGVIPYGMALDPLGAIYVVGGYRNPDDSNNEFVLLAKYDPDGYESWTKLFTHTSTWSSADGVAVLPGGDVVITGSFNGSIDFGGGEFSTAAVYETYSMSNGFIARFTASGSHVFSDRFGGTIFDRGMDVVALSDGDFVVSGLVSGQVNVGGLPSEGHEAEGTPFLARFDGSGVARWVDVVPSRGTPYALIADPDESLLHLAGLFSGNHFLFEVTASGEVALSATALGTEIWTHSLAVDASRSLWVSGAYRYDVDFGPEAAFESENSGVYLLRLDREEP